MVEPRPYQPAHAPPAIGQRLRAIMLVLGLGASDMAEAIGATEPHVLDWLEGRSRPPPLLMNRLANRAGVTLAFIYFGEQQDLPPGTLERLRSVNGQTPTRTRRSSG